MKELFKQIQNEQLAEAYSSKELYEFLELEAKNYSHWIKRNIINNTFATEGEDYVFHDNVRNIEGSTYSSLKTNRLGGKSSEDFALTPTFAKKLSMQAPGVKGETARDYFLQCERLAKALYQTHNIFSIKEGKIMTDTNLIAKTSGIPISEINRNVKNWIDSHCNVILEGDPIYFNKYRLVPKKNKGGVIAKMICGNVFITKSEISTQLVYHMSDIAILRFLDRYCSIDAVKQLLPVFKKEISQNELLLGNKIWNLSLPEARSHTENLMHKFLSDRAGMFSNFEYAKRCYDEFRIQNDIPRENDLKFFKAEYVRYGNSLR
ncbi:antA/AntB antirepressor family protein [Sphingobacterium spiritivorum]|uniref:antA/AntB antirepressor family protein n=1 Tax=Sphingobacterium spiritivorum TaxID=258 RepID=UPI003DA1D488